MAARPPPSPSLTLLLLIRPRCCPMKTRELVVTVAHMVASWQTIFRNWTVKLGDMAQRETGHVGPFFIGSLTSVGNGDEDEKCRVVARRHVASI